MNNNDIPLPKDSSKVYNENHMQNCNVFLGDMHGCAFGVPGTSITINNLIRRINDARKVTSIVVTHDLQGALLFADRILMLKAGHVVACETPERFVLSDNPEVQEFLAAQFITERSFREARSEYEKAR